MANVLIDENSMTAIADAIRSKNGTQNTYKPAQMAEAISAISGGGITPTGTKSITANGTYDVTNFASAEVNVPTESSEWLDVTPDLATVTFTDESGVSHSYNESTDELRVYTTANGAYKSTRFPVSVEAGTKYRLECTVIKTGTPNITFGLRNSHTFTFIMNTTALTNSSTYAIESTPSDFAAFEAQNVVVSFMVTQGTSASGDATFKNFRIYKYVGD